MQWPSNTWDRDTRNELKNGWIYYDKFGILN